MKNPVTVVTTAPENEHLSRVEDAWKTGLHGLSSSADQFLPRRPIYYNYQVTGVRKAKHRAGPCSQHVRRGASSSCMIVLPFANY